jgi:hypothetical protein
MIHVPFYFIILAPTAHGLRKMDDKSTIRGIKSANLETQGCKTSMANKQILHNGGSFRGIGPGPLPVDPAVPNFIEEG